MEIFTLPLGSVQANCFIIVAENKDSIIIDPGGHGRKLIDFIEKSQLKPQAILLTHAHFDHIGAVDELVEKWLMPVHVHEKEVERLQDPSINGSRMFHMPDTVVHTKPEIIDSEGELKVGSFTFHVYDTPGHSPGSVSFYLPEEKAVFSGDVLFQGSIGRTDFVGGDFDTLEKSIREKLYALPNDTTVYSGHGFATDIGSEKLHNPFVKK